MFDRIRNTFSGFWQYALGRGLITTATVAASFVASATGLSIIAVGAVALGSVAWNTFTGLLRAQRYENQMLDFYREEVAAAVGKDPSGVDIPDLKKAAYGDRATGIPRNEVLAYALDRQKAKGWLSLATSIAAGAVTFGLLMTPLPEFISAQLDIGGQLGNLLGSASAGIIAATSSLFVHRGLDNAIGNATRINNLSAHDRILLIERSQNRGRSVKPEQVMDVFVAANPTLNNRIRSEYGERYQGMNRAEKLQVIRGLGVGSLMNRLAEGLGSGAIDATELAFISNGAEPLSVRGRATIAGTKHQAAEIENGPQPKRSFVEMVGGSRNSNQQSFADKILAEREQAGEAARA